MKAATKPDEQSGEERSKGFFEDLLAYEKQRYQHKGYGLIFATLITLFWFFVVPQTAQYWYPKKKFENEGTAYVIGAYFAHELCFIVCNIIFYFIYISEMYLQQ